MLFSNQGKKQVVAAFDGGEITSDAGVLLLRESERQLNLSTRIGSVPMSPAYLTTFRLISRFFILINMLPSKYVATNKTGCFLMRYADFGSRVVFAAFDGGEITSDAGVFPAFVTNFPSFNNNLNDNS
jgi:hypothetical protein